MAVIAAYTTSPLVAYSALNTSLNELLGGVLQPTLPDLNVSLPWPEKFIHVETEDYTLFGSNSLYRRTAGFHGDLAFDVNVSPDDPPNVLVLVVESFRFHDSRYLVGDEDPSNLFRGTNLTITPNFDRWAKRGVALRNFWSSWRTSRSVESILFGQLPYDSTTESGMTGGRNDTKLSGLPQLFTAKGYETFFTTGCTTDYDAWDLFLPSHGFDTVWGRGEMMELAERDLGIKSDEWFGAEHRSLSWGVHDDLSFELLGNLMINKTKEQSERRADKKPKKPLFLTHYTISSHVDFKQRPRWFDEAVKPNFSALYEGKEYADNIQNYQEIRYFTDMELGKFMDRMGEEGILNDTIVVIVGDHGQGPEFGNNVPEDRDVSATRVAGTIIAEGRMADAAGLVIDDATEQRVRSGRSGSFFEAQD
uniref:Sulfatase N-terminal domain-containing protein n=1 Tax=Hyaloperonospora arabidopsidis (strain Emoy2) TaxID=559515 RepID=M4C5X9_HYAAE